MNTITQGILHTKYSTIFKLKGKKRKFVEKEVFVSFQWKQLSTNSFLVIIPKVLKKQKGDYFAIISLRKFKKLLFESNKH